MKILFFTISFRGKKLLPTISGTASDAFGISSVKVAYQQNPPFGPWWDGSSGFTSLYAPQFFTAQGTTLWTHSQSNSPNSPVWSNNTQYLVEAYAYNLAQTSSSLVSATFWYDNITVIAQPSGCNNAPPATIVNIVKSTVVNATLYNGEQGACTYTPTTGCTVM